ncbi:hypothetical protein M9H77_18278 [Catharanthus roseus]|uniref:Uncharacterized protein n=1 Tax=Catharanthus roseus TaxID=4058 RepID=A0ACC0B702_CATRO|nr:hypothetical protein M9H77_18278 [Catharanthus roseus]
MRDGGWGRGVGKHTGSSVSFTEHRLKREAVATGVPLPNDLQLMAPVSGGLECGRLYGAGSKATHLRAESSRAAAGLPPCCLEAEQRIMRQVEAVISSAYTTFNEQIRRSENKEDPMLAVLENKGKSSEKELHIIHRDITISFSLSPFSLCHEVSLRDLEMLLVAYTSHVSIFGGLYAISLDGNLFLLVPGMLKCLTLCVSLENQLVPNVFKCLSSHASFVNYLIPSEAKLDLLCFENENLHDDSVMEPKVVES